ncbi:MAG: hypothetical protein LVQ64_00325 [Thermoplasmatales archaeon]|nr:hypothetical protein [Thermoplasmatales archaeon]
MAIRAPLHVHRPTVVRLDPPSEGRETLDSLVRELLSAAVLLGKILPLVSSTLGPDGNRR